LKQAGGLTLEQKQKIYEALEQMQIPYEVYEHPAAHTIEDIDALDIFRDKPWVAKNLFLRDEKGKRHFLIVMDKDKQADLKYIRDQLGTSRLSFASEERLMKYLKLTKGSVTPLGIMNDEELAVELAFDKDLVGREMIGVHPNDNTATVFLSYADLSQFIKSHGNPIHLIHL
jgi:Ala-tRNA(Pro) deacylase